MPTQNLTLPRNALVLPCLVFLSMRLRCELRLGFVARRALCTLVAETINSFKRASASSLFNS